MKKIIIILTVILCSCSNKDTTEDYLRQVGIHLTENYTVLNHKEDWAIGDYSKNFELKISNKDFELIIKKIQQTEYYKELKEGEKPDGFFTLDNSDKIIAYKSGTTYYYEIEKAKPQGTSIENYYILLTSGNILNFTYVSE